MKMDDSKQEITKSDKNKWTWMKVDRSRWKRIELDECGWKLMIGHWIKVKESVLRVDKSGSKVIKVNLGK